MQIKIFMNHRLLNQAILFACKFPKRCYLSRNILKLHERGLWKDRFPESCVEFERDLVAKQQTVYSGFDPTANSLHIGNLLVLTALLHFQRSGHNVIVLIGGATGAVGDPSGKNAERLLIEPSVIRSNSEAIESIITNIFTNHEKYIWKENTRDEKALPPIKIVNNADWYKELNVISFLRKGKHIAMGSLLRRSSIQTRLERNKPLSFTEFSYQVLQAYDWLHLYQKYNCTIQVGGSDQMGNIVCGHNLISRLKDIQVTGLTVPLITTLEGDKLGKTAGNAIWLSPDKTSPFDFYQYFIRLPDSEVENLLKLLTFISLSEIKTLMELHQKNPEKRLAQKKLAEKLTLLVHGEDGLRTARHCTDILYGGNAGSLAEISSDDVINLFKGSSITSQIMEPGMSILDLTMKANCFPSDLKAVTVIEAGGLQINNAKVMDPHLALIPTVHILPNKLTLLKIGKKNYHIVKWMM